MNLTLRLALPAARLKGLSGMAGRSNRVAKGSSHMPGSSRRVAEVANHVAQTPRRRRFHPILMPKVTHQFGHVI